MGDVRAAAETGALCSMRSVRLRSTCYLWAGWSTVEQPYDCSIDIGLLEQVFRTDVLQMRAKQQNNREKILSN